MGKSGSRQNGRWQVCLQCNSKGFSFIYFIIKCVWGGGCSGDFLSTSKKNPDWMGISANVFDSSLKDSFNE